MQKYADYIRRIEIDSLWSGKKHVVWELNRQVNILSGINGVGKSTILNKIIKSVNTNGDIINHLLKGVHIDVEPADATHIRFDIIRSLDSPMLDNETLNMVDTRIRSALDFQLFHLQRKYLDYQVNIGNRIIEQLQQGHADAAQQLSSCRRRRAASRTSSTTCSRIPARRSSGRRTRYGSRRSVRRWCPINCRAARSRSWLSCSPCWWRITSPTCSSWMNPKCRSISSGRSVSSTSVWN